MRIVVFVVVWMVRRKVGGCVRLIGCVVVVFVDIATTESDSVLFFPWHDGCGTREIE